MGRSKDLTGRRFGKLTVQRLGEPLHRANGKPRRRWECVCDCGNTALVMSENLLSGNTLSCGCVQKERARAYKMTHNMTNTRLYGVWTAMKARCYNRNLSTYPLYGGRGIEVCSEWVDNFEAFYEWAIANGYDENAPRGQCTIDRIDCDGNYCSENCRIVTQVEQMNNVRYNRHVVYNEQDYTVANLARTLDIPYSNLLSALNRYDDDVSLALQHLH